MSTVDDGCPECSGRLNASGDETVCAECGLVVAADRIDRGPEWRSFDDDEENRERTGAPLDRSRHDRGLTTEIGSTRGLEGRRRRRMARLRRQHDRTRIASKSERNRVYGFTEIRRLTGELDLPRSVRDFACKLFETAQDRDLLRGRSIEGFAAAAVYAACRTNSVSRTRSEVTDTARADADELAAAYDALNREVGLRTGPIDPREYLPRFASQLDLSAETEARAREVATRAREAGRIGGRNPSGVAAACLYVAADRRDEPLTQAEVAEVADVSPATVRDTRNAILD
ncbi:transcription initiation factor IIB [Halobacteriales archaeon QS_8_69_26]|nr:MAG: transcription initiation factor IIB [Halobacteriales archaeon QS_8_69_26]